MTTNPGQRTVVGLMSGTSLDGVDAALVHLSGSGSSMDVMPAGFISVPYPEALKVLLLRNSFPESSSVYDLCQLNVRLAHVYAEVVHALATECNISLEMIDAIGCSGQTVFHVPENEECAGVPTRSTLQLGDPSTLSQRLKKTVVGDFRLADMAQGGQGAPLVSYFDYVYFSHEEEARALLNIGGIANMTILPSGATPANVTAFDTGPGNMIIDRLAQRFWNTPYDPNGHYASTGTPNSALLNWLLDIPYYRLPPPKSTGRELYNDTYIDTLVEKARETGIHSNEDLMATVTMLTAESIAMGYEAFIEKDCQLDKIIASGGGIHNKTLLSMLRSRLPQILVHTVDQYGIDSDAKEAICFAVLAHETLNGVTSSIATATGANKPAILGKICLHA